MADDNKGVEVIVDPSSLSAEQQQLVEKASEAKEQAHCPYSKFHVGAALLTTSGRVFHGCNVENAAYPLCTCAERVAITKAASEGELYLHRAGEDASADKYIHTIAVITNMEDGFPTPCGGCRQVIYEFGGANNCTILCVKASKKSCLQTTIKQLLPHAFGPDALEK